MSAQITCDHCNAVVPVRGVSWLSVQYPSVDNISYSPHQYDFCSLDCAIQGLQVLRDESAKRAAEISASHTRAEAEISKPRAGRLAARKAWFLGWF